MGRMKNLTTAVLILLCQPALADPLPPGTVQLRGPTGPNVTTTTVGGKQGLDVNIVNSSGTSTVNQGTPNTASNAWPVYLCDSGGAQCMAINSDGSLNVDATITGPVAVTGTFWQSTQPVSAVSWPLPTGAATSSNQASQITQETTTASNTTSILANQTNGTQQVKVVNTPTVSISPLPTTSPIPVVITGPSPLPVTGSVFVQNFPSPTPSQVVVIAGPSPLPVQGNVSVVNSPTVSISPLPTTSPIPVVVTGPSPLPVSGIVTVSNFPSPTPSQVVVIAGPSPLPVSGNVSVTNTPTVSISPLPTSSPVPVVITGPSPLPVSGNVSVVNTPTVSISPLPTTSPLPVAIQGGSSAFGYLSGRGVLSTFTQSYASSNLSTSSFTTIITSTASTINEEVVFDNSGGLWYLAYASACGSLSNASNAVIVAPGGGGIDLLIPSGQCVGFEAIGSNITSGNVYMTFLK
jgi:hypothetical protein